MLSKGSISGMNGNTAVQAGKVRSEMERRVDLYFGFEKISKKGLGGRGTTVRRAVDKW